MNVLDNITCSLSCTASAASAKPATRTKFSRTAKSMVVPSRPYVLKDLRPRAKRSAGESNSARNQRWRGSRARRVRLPDNDAQSAGVAVAAAAASAGGGSVRSLR